MVWLNLVFQVLVLLLGLFILGKSAQFVVTAVTRIGHSLRISQFVTGFVILGVATSLPEMFVGVQSALLNTPQLSLGNLFGANVVLLTLISGLAAFLNRGVSIKQEMAHSNRLLHISVLVLAPLVLLIDAHLSRLDAAFLAIMYLGYLLFTYKQGPPKSQAHPLSRPLMNHQVFHTAFLATAGLVGLLVASKAVVFSGVNIASILHIPTLIIGTVFLSIGTNLPEISVVVAAIRRHHTNLVIGDVLGSVSTNTLVMAMLGGIAPFSTSELGIIESAGIAMIISLAVFMWFAKTKDRLSYREGLVLIGLYVAFLTSQAASLYFK